jgi:hypothetical protein
MTTEESYGWEIVIEPDQTCVKPRIKVRDGHVPTHDDIKKVVFAFELLGATIKEKGFKVAPIK